nr:hypothetical protein [Burkholderia diffusa]
MGRFVSKDPIGYAGGGITYGSMHQTRLSGATR